MSNPQPPPQQPTSTQQRSRAVMSRNTDMLFQALATLGWGAMERQMQAVIQERVVQAEEGEVTEDAGLVRKDAVRPDGLEYVAKVKGTTDEAEAEWAKMILWLRGKMPEVSGDTGNL